LRENSSIGYAADYGGTSNPSSSHINPHPPKPFTGGRYEALFARPFRRSVLAAEFIGQVTF
jgi:hypothetical protein